MNILVDADACPVKDQIKNIAINYQNIKCVLYFDTAHNYESDYFEIIQVDKGFDSVDFKILSDAKKDDIVVTQDYGLASLALSKGCLCLNQNGIIFTNDNIDSYLDSRYIGSVIRNSSSKTRLKGPKKRTQQDDANFIRSFTKILNDQNIKK